MLKVVTFLLLTVLLLSVAAGLKECDLCCENGRCDNYLQCKCDISCLWAVYDHQPPVVISAVVSLTATAGAIAPSDICLGQIDRPPRLFT